MSKWLIGVCGYDGRTYDVKRTCEVIVSDMQRPTDEWEYCGRPTTHFYPTQRGTQSLCSVHAQQHVPHGAWPVSDPSHEQDAAHEALPPTRARA